MSAPNCGKCRFWELFYPGQGLCRYNPPVVVVLPDHGTITEFPKTGKSEWCGKFEEES